MSKTSTDKNTPTIQLLSEKSSEVQLDKKWIEFKCTLCDKIFLTEHSLIFHMRLHSSERPYKCKECGNKFKSNEILKKHSTIHTNEKLFECNVCDYNLNASKNTASQLSHENSH